MENINYIVKLELNTDKDTAEKVYASVLAQLSKSSEGNLFANGFSLSIMPAPSEEEINAELKREFDEESKDFFKY